jgi:hypothetical protein
MFSTLRPLVSRFKLGVYFKEVFLGLFIATIWAAVIGVAMVCVATLCRPILFSILIGIRWGFDVPLDAFLKSSSVPLVLYFCTMGAGCLATLLAGIPAGLYIATEAETRKAVYRKYFIGMTCWGLSVMALVILIAETAISAGAWDGLP